MFDLFYKKYKLDVLGKRKWVDCGDLELYEKVCCIGEVASSQFSLPFLKLQDKFYLLQVQRQDFWELL